MSETVMIDGQKVVVKLGEHAHKFTVPIQVVIDSERVTKEVRNVSKLMCEFCDEVKKLKITKYNG